MEEQHELKRDLKNRHVQLIAIGGTIGTGLFLGSGKAIEKAGPSILLVYLIIGISLFFVMRALGELLLSNAGYQSFTDFAAVYVGPWAGYITGWTYWFCWIMTAMADIIEAICEGSRMLDLDLFHSLSQMNDSFIAFNAEDSECGWLKPIKHASY